MSEVYNEDYYTRGEALGISNYSDYRWMPDASLPMVDHLKRFLHIQDGESLIEIGTARGYAVKALRMRSVNAWGYDISKWAVENCDPQVKQYVTNDNAILRNPYDFLYMKDAAEHCTVEQLCEMLPPVLRNIRKTACFIVPLARDTGGPYINPLDQKDATHIIRWTMQDWLTFLQKMDCSFVVSGSYRVPLLKLSSELYPCSAAFIKMERFET